nr:efflux RND transporter periplasmic adaptor subunit [Pseudemcibacter aquimaris]
MPPPAVSVLQINTETINREEILPGRVAAFRQAEIRPQVEGIITERLFEEGAAVERGQALYQIDDTPYRAALASANADLVSAEANLRAATAKEARFKELIKTNAVSGQAYDDVKAELDRATANIAVAKANIEVAQVNLNYTKVYAPISGRIGRTMVTEGALVTTNQSDSLTQITQLDPIYIDISQPGNDALRLRSEMSNGNDLPVQVVLDNAAGVSYEEQGVLKFSDVVVEESTGSVGLRALMPNKSQLLLPGLFVRVKIELGEQDALLVPQRATTRNPDGTLTVWTIDANNQVSPKMITVSGAHGDQWIVSSGLNSGDTIVIEGYQKIGPGMTVMPSPWSPSS